MTATLSRTIDSTTLATLREEFPILREHTYDGRAEEVVKLLESAIAAKRQRAMA